MKKLVYLVAFSSLMYGLVPLKATDISATNATIGGGSSSINGSLGVCATATGTASFAQYYSYAAGTGSVAMGNNSHANGVQSMALSSGVANGDYSFAAQGSQTFGLYSTGFSYGYAPGAYSFAGGYGNSMGQNSFSYSYSGISHGDFAASFGQYTGANAYNCFAIGRYNLASYGTNGMTTWIDTDPLFEIGNGADGAHRADAFVVYKNGNGQIHGTFRCAAGGDLSMGSYTAGTHP